MTLPPSDDRPDDLINAYRRASEGEATQPSPQVRAIILSRAAHRSKTTQRAPVRGRVLSWQWKAAASLAVVGLVGVLTSQILHTPPQEPEQQHSAASAPPASQMRESAPAVAADKPLNSPATNAPARKTAGTATPKPLSPAVSVSPSTSVPEVPEAAQGVARAPAPASASASARSADLVAQNSVVPAASLDPWKVKTLEALRSSYPELFSAPDSLSTARAEPVQIALVMNEDGTVYKTAYDTPAGQDQATPAVRLTLTLGVSPLELAAPVRLFVFDRGNGQPMRIDVAVGIRKAR